MDNIEKLENAVQEALGLRYFTVKCSWESSDSFTDDDHPPSRYRDLLDITWTSQNLAEKAAKRIQEHSDWYEASNRTYMPSVPKPAWLLTHSNQCHLNLTLDNGTEHTIFASWVGYFEWLYDVEVVELLYDPDTKEYVEKDSRS